MKRCEREGSHDNTSILKCIRGWDDSMAVAVHGGSDICAPQKGGDDYKQ